MRVSLPKRSPTRYKCAYVAKGSDAFNAMGAKWPGDVKEAAWVADYNPANTMLLGITRKDGGLSSYRVDFGRLFEGR